MRKQFAFLSSVALLIITSALPAIGAMKDNSFVRLCRTGTFEEVFEALNDGANPNAQRYDGLTALMAAAGDNQDDMVVTLLIEFGADVNASVNGLTPLMLAAILNQNADVTTTLINYGADVNASVEGLTPLIMAAEFNDNPQVTEAILNAPGVDVLDDEIDWLAAQKSFAAERSQKNKAKSVVKSKKSSTTPIKSSSLNRFSYGDGLALAEAGFPEEAGWLYFHMNFGFGD